MSFLYHRSLTLLLLVALLCGCSKTKDDLTLDHATFKPGQVWTYKTRKGDEDSLLTILKLEDDDKFGQIAHIHVSNVKVPTKFNPDGEYKSIKHTPLTLNNLQASVVELQTTVDDIPDFHEGYTLWREAVTNSGAGVFKLDVAECVEYTTQVVKSHLKPASGG